MEWIDAWLLSLRDNELVNMCDLGDMLEGAPLNLSQALNAPLLWLVVVTLIGVWVLLAGFPREVQRLTWAWSRPRNLALRNASETPRTMGAALNVAMSMTGLTTGVWLMEDQAAVPIAWWGVPVWVLGGLMLRVIFGRVAFGPGDLSSALVELGRHNNTWVGLSTAVCTGVVVFSPHLQTQQWGTLGLVVIFGCAMIHGGLRATQLVRSSNSQRLVGILYLCILEWGWTVFWVSWSVGLLLRGH